MPRYLSLEWPDEAPFRDRDGAPIRILAVSDEFDPVLQDLRNRKSLGKIDLVLGCGDLAADDLSFIVDLVNAPLIYVRGNHDGGEKWVRDSAFLPSTIESTRAVHESGLTVVRLTWPGHKGKGAMRNEGLAWKQAVKLAIRRLGRDEPMIVISHVPPLGVGDIPTTGYHRGFHGYRWLLDRVRPRLWLHGHTPLAACRDWLLTYQDTTLANVTGAVVIELHPPGTPGLPKTNRNGHRSG